MRLACVGLRFRPEAVRRIDLAMRDKATLDDLGETVELFYDTANPYNPKAVGFRFRDDESVIGYVPEDDLAKARKTLAGKSLSKIELVLDSVKTRSGTLQSLVFEAIVE